MNYPKKKLDSVEVMRITNMWNNYAEETIKGVVNYLNDTNSAERRKVSICKVCFYLRPGRIGGAAMTTQPCAICEKDQTYGNTCTDPLCLPCAQREKLCKHCGGDVLSRGRRVFVPTESQEND